MLTLDFNCVETRDIRDLPKVTQLSGVESNRTLISDFDSPHATALVCLYEVEIGEDVWKQKHKKN